MSELPETAEEYAKELNGSTEEWLAGGEDRVAGMLPTEPEYWAERDVHTGEDLARYLAIQDHWDLYKDVTGVRPRGFDYDSMSLEEIEAEVADLASEWEYMRNDPNFDDYAPPESYPDPLRSMEVDPDEPYAEQEPIETHPSHLGMGRSAGMPRRMREEGVVRLGCADLQVLIAETIKSV